MYRFIFNCWRMNKITEEDVKSFVSKGFISELQATDILSSPKEAQ